MDELVVVDDELVCCVWYKITSIKLLRIYIKESALIC